MKNPNNQRRGNRGPKYHKKDNTQGSNRKYSREQPQGQDQTSKRPFKKRFIKRDKDGKPRIAKRKDGKVPRKGHKGQKRAQDRDLDRELRNYWLTHKGGNRDDQDLKEVAREKLNSELDSYWKERKEENEPKAN